MNVNNFLLAIFLSGCAEECQREANRKKTVTTYQYCFKYNRAAKGVSWAISTHLQAGEC